MLVAAWVGGTRLIDNVPLELAEGLPGPDMVGGLAHPSGRA
jgi:hypothetical protein